MKYELPLIFLLEVTLLHVLRTLGIYLGGKLTSFYRINGAMQSLLNCRYFIMVLFLDTCPSQNSLARESLIKVRNNAITFEKRPSQLGQQMLIYFFCADGRQAASVGGMHLSQHNSSADNVLIWLKLSTFLLLKEG